MVATPTNFMKHRRIAILEFACGGGMAMQPVQEIPTSILREGRAMLYALASDWAQLSDWDVFVCWDSKFGKCAISNVAVQTIDANESFLDAWKVLANKVDFVLVIAPEIDNQLAEITKALRTCGACLLNADSLFIEAASDKWLTAQSLQLANLPHPKTERVSNFIRLDLPHKTTTDDDRSNAWTIKPRDGAGCHEVHRLESLPDVRRYIAEASPMIRDWNRYILQPWIEGISGSVAVLCGPGRECVLPAMSQTLSMVTNSSISEVQYLGGAGPFQAISPSALNAFANRVIRSLPGSPLGWVGIDFVVVNSNALDDSIVAIEVNSRLTTSYLGLRSIIQENPAGLLFQVAIGQDARFTLSGRSTTFDSFGTFAHD